MPAITIDTASMARDAALNLVARATGVRTGSASGVGSSARRGRRVIGGGIIAAIVIGALLGIAVIVLAIFFWRRHSAQKKRREAEMGKYYGDNRSSMAPSDNGMNNNTYTTPNMGANAGGYNYAGQGYGYAHTAAPGEYGYGAQNNGVSGMQQAHTANHVHSTK
ncbi:hypothetical protein CMUS01_15854 [Colletotrichum musicola]|uniref:Uncharacterized protein n=1 Tax=Colletotrichum musicola TaxID=2175873 RepID=A0A8H6ISZ4_9PEZI|nr:hypothetical protein CMUS01_15854 [Colletotrichum musicola]